MNKLTFVKGMEYLKAYYSASVFKVDIENELVQVVWYDALKQIDDKSFDYLIKDYSRKNEFPPQSPTHLLNHFDNLLEVYAIETLNKVKQLESNNLIIDRDRNQAWVDYNKAIKATNGDIILINILTDLKNNKLNSINKDNIKEYLLNNNNGNNKQLSLGVK